MAQQSARQFAQRRSRSVLIIGVAMTVLSTALSAAEAPLKVGVIAPLSLQFVKDYQQAYGGEMPNVHAFFHWETLRLLAEAIREAHSDDPAKVRDALALIRDPSAMGEVVFDDHHQAVLPMALVEIENDRPVIKATMAPKIEYAAH
ncbi:ABC transporter substrate-binding protein [Pseudomonas cerasi]|uniref:Leucine-binding protein domain-containing protein n=1 Tax=Pseudomonas cerasi TaxID=1583341 RepID=A0A193SSW7_9PSED|nr:ABC transporter substrate-binding protein [Pseudomonas cerasi]CZT30125.1 hypothetical protein PCPL58_3669 [Pseudomonas cerasi]SOS21846.1 hypothetical protein PL963_03759 [Pseudomonas cerasi]